MVPGSRAEQFQGEGSGPRQARMWGIMAQAGEASCQHSQHTPASYRGPGGLGRNGPGPAPAPPRPGSSRAGQRPRNCGRSGGSRHQAPQAQPKPSRALRGRRDDAHICRAPDPRPPPPASCGSPRRSPAGLIAAVRAPASIIQT